MLGILLLIFLLLLNAFFSISETVFIAVHRTKLESLKEKGNKRAAVALSLAESPELFLSTVQIGITIISFLTGYISIDVCGVYVQSLLRALSFDFYVEEVTSVTILIVVTYLSSLFAELLPKRLGIIYADTLAPSLAYPLLFFLRILYPLVWLLSRSSNLIFKWLKIKHVKKSSFTEQEIKSILQESEEQGNIDEDEREIIERIFDLGNRSITSMMLHRQHLNYLDVSDTIKEARAKILKDPHYRYPVCDGDIDNLKGIVTLNKIFTAKSDKTTIQKIMQKPMIVPEGISAYKVIEQMKTTRQQTCFVVDEYGSVEGMLTFTDLLEAIVGDIPDYKEEKPPIIQLKEGNYLADGKMPFYEFLEYFNRETYHSEEDEESDKYDTVAGFLIFQFEKIPAEGDLIEWKEFTFQIADMDGHRIDKVVVDLKKEKKKEEKKEIENR